MTEISALSTLGGAILGALLGSYGTYLARERSRKKQERERIENLRRSLVAELGSMDELATQKASNYATQIPAHSTISAEVYKSNSSEISLLTPKEAETVIRFYSGAIKLEQTLDTTRELVVESEYPQMHNLSSLNESIDVLRKEWKKCVLALISHLEDYPSEIQIDDKQIPVDESISPGDLWLVLNHKKLEFDDSNIEFIK